MCVCVLWIFVSRVELYVSNVVACSRKLTYFIQTSMMEEQTFTNDECVLGICKYLWNDETTCKYKKWFSFSEHPANSFWVCIYSFIYSQQRYGRAKWLLNSESVLENVIYRRKIFWVFCIIFFLSLCRFSFFMMIHFKVSIYTQEYCVFSYPCRRFMCICNKNNNTKL